MRLKKVPVMKNAYELAMERAGVEPVVSLAEDQKQKIAEIESIFKAKRAEAELSANTRVQKAMGNIEEIDQIREDLAVELASLKSKYEQEKDVIRKFPVN